MSRSRKGGRKGGLIGQAATVVVIGAAIIGFFGIPARPDVSGIPDMLVSKSQTVEAWMENCVPGAMKFDFSMCSLISNVQGAPGTGEAGEKEASKAMSMLDSLPQGEPQSVAYNRDEWKHWGKAGLNSCWDVREAVLLDEAAPGTAVLKDKDGNTVDNESRACSITGGSWTDPYTGAVITDPSQLDIDHLIPLSYAAKQGGQAWDAKQKERFANDRAYSNHLIAVSASANRSKSDQGPASWKPANTAFHCTYAVSWIQVSKNYDLTIPAADAAALREMLSTC